MRGLPRARCQVLERGARWVGGCAYLRGGLPGLRKALHWDLRGVGVTQPCEHKLGASRKKAARAMPAAAGARWAGRAGEAPGTPSLTALVRDSEEFNVTAERASLAPENPR